MRHFTIITGVSIICAVLLAGGISYSAPDIPAIRDAKDSAERDRIKALIDGAQKEKRLDWVGLFIEPSHSEQIITGFKEYYGLPDLKCNYTYGMGADIIGRVTQTLEGGRTPPDILWMVAWDWYVDLMKRGKLMRYDSPYYEECTFSHKAGLSMPGYWVSDSYTNMPLWNKKALEKMGINNFNPSSWSDFVDPRLPPLTSLGNLANPTTNAPWGIAMRRVMGDEWFVKLAKGKAVPFEKAGQAETWLASGEYPICLNMRIKYAQSLEKSGVEVRWLWPKEGQVMVPFALSILASAAHPNTAKLFVDYVRSARGAEKMASTGVMLVYARPGVKVPEQERKYWPTDEMKVIPFDYDKDLTREAVRAFNSWAKKIGIGH